MPNDPAPPDNRTRRKKFVDFAVRTSWPLYFLLILLLIALAAIVYFFPDVGKHPRLLSAIWVILLLLLAIPVMLFLVRGWSHRRDDILSSISPKAATLYLRNFHQLDKKTRDRYDRALKSVDGSDDDSEDHSDEETGDALIPEDVFSDGLRRFKDIYTSRFGRWRYFLPTTLLIVLAAFLLSFPMAEARCDWDRIVCASSHQAEVSALPFLAGAAAAPATEPEKRTNSDWGWVIALAILGGYTRVVYELVLRYYQDNIRPADLFWWCYRLIISVPLGYGVGIVLGGGVNYRTAYVIAYTLGLFPTSTVTDLGRYIFMTQIKAPGNGNAPVSQLSQMSSLDTASILLLSEEGITNCTDLAYTDPIRLSFRTGKDFAIVITWVSEALLMIYLTTREQMNEARLFGIGGAYEANTLWQDAYGNEGRNDEDEEAEGDEAAEAEADADAGAEENEAGANAEGADDATANEEDQSDEAVAKQIIVDLAKELKTKKGGLRNIIKQVAWDPYTLFVVECWDSIFSRKH